MTPPPCTCEGAHNAPRLIALTGGPGAGKTATLEIIRRVFCSHVHVLPESASILFGGGFPRLPTDIGRRSAQRAIYRIQRELEGMILSDSHPAVVLCDRGTPDGAAYWPGGPDSFFGEFQTRREDELARYSAVIHLRTPPANLGFNHQNVLRTESAAEAIELDHRVELAWNGHPRRFFVESKAGFMDKVLSALQLLEAELPHCCRTHLSARRASHPVVGESAFQVPTEPSAV